MFTLYAEREGHAMKQAGQLNSLREAASFVETAEAHGLWPEGYDAVVYFGTSRDLTAEAWVFINGWEKVQ